MVSLGHARLALFVYLAQSLNTMTLAVCCLACFFYTPVLLCTATTKELVDQFVGHMQIIRDLETEPLTLTFSVHAPNPILNLSSA